MNAPAAKVTVPAVSIPRCETCINDRLPCDYCTGEYVDYRLAEYDKLYAQAQDAIIDLESRLVTAQAELRGIMSAQLLWENRKEASMAGTLEVTV